MQYFRPAGSLNVGDCMPFYHEGVFRLYYLLDEGHHSALGGLGGHQWAQASTRDLVRWEHHPLAIPITDEREGSICTGSVLYHQGTYYAFYATRMRDRTQHLSLATSQDGVRFHKQEPNPFASPPQGYSPYHFRDPCAFQDDEGLFHLLVTAMLDEWPIAGRGGCLAHLVSDDLSAWRVEEPFIVPGLTGAPECPDYFRWGDHYYLVFSNGGVARYRMAAEPFGPWERPEMDTLDGPAARVMKTAPFGPNRRLGVAFLGTREGDLDEGRLQYAGNAIFRELRQGRDGALGLTWPAEMIPPGVELRETLFAPLSVHTVCQGREITIGEGQGLGAAVCVGLPADLRLRLQIKARPYGGEFGLRLRASDAFDSGYDLRFSPRDRVVSLNRQQISGVSGIWGAFDLQVICLGDLIDVCIDGQRTLIDRCPAQRGDRVYLYAQDAVARFRVVEVAAI